jgi:hypothetical protein
VYDFENNMTERYAFGTPVPVSLYPGFEMTVEA